MLKNAKEEHGLLLLGGTSFYEENFENNNYKLLDEKEFYAKYKEYYYKIYLVEYIGDFNN